MEQTDSPPPAALGRGMAQSRAPIHHRYEPESAIPSSGRRTTRSSDKLGRKPDEWEEDEEEEDVGREHRDWEPPRHNEPHVDYGGLNRRLAPMKAEEQAERQRKKAELSDPIKPKLRKPEKTQELSLPLLFGGLLLLLVVVGITTYVKCSRPVDPKIYDDWLSDNLTANIRVMRAEFPSQANNTWLNFYAGIRRVLLDDPTEPSVFLLVHRGGDGEETCACLARRVARVAQGVLGAPSSEPLMMDGATLDSYADGRLIDTYGPLVERHRTVVLERLHMVPAGVARALHIFCDTVTPLVRKAVYIFTLDVGGVAEGGSTSEVAQRGLYTAWGRQLDPDILAPLVTRVMGGFVFGIEPERNGATVC